MHLCCIPLHVSVIVIVVVVVVSIVVSMAMFVSKLHQLAYVGTRYNCCKQDITVLTNGVTVLTNYCTSLKFYKPFLA